MSEGFWAPSSENIKWLKFLHFIGYIWGLFGLIFLYAAFSILLSGHERTQEDFFIQWVYLICGSVFILSGVGLIIKPTWGKPACIIGACLSLIAFPVGTIGGVLVFLGMRKNQEAFKGKKL